MPLVFVFFLLPIGDSSRLLLHWYILLLPLLHAAGYIALEAAAAIGLNLFLASFILVSASQAERRSLFLLYIHIRLYIRVSVPKWIKTHTT